MFDSFEGTGGPFEEGEGFELATVMPLETALPETLWVTGLVLPRCHAFGVEGFLR